MKNTDIHKLLDQLKLKGMQECVDDILIEAQKKERTTAWVLKQVLTEEYRYRKERSQANRLKQAKIPWSWTLETFPFERQPGVSAQQIKALSNLDFMDRNDNIVLIGPPGTGKTGIAVSLLRQALIDGYTGRYYNAQELIEELYASLADSSTLNLLNKLARYDLLLIDELGYLTLHDEQVNAFFKLLDQRYSRGSTIITTNLDYPEWYDLFRRKALVDAMLDRLRHHCITIQIDGPSLRTS
jgi:DNA replication protein DnaC